MPRKIDSTTPWVHWGVETVLAVYLIFFWIVTYPGISANKYGCNRFLLASGAGALALIQGCRFIWEQRQWHGDLLMSTVANWPTLLIIICSTASFFWSMFGAGFACGGG